MSLLVLVKFYSNIRYYHGHQLQDAAGGALIQLENKRLPGGWSTKPSQPQAPAASQAHQAPHAVVWGAGKGSQGPAGGSPPFHRVLSQPVPASPSDSDSPRLAQLGPELQRKAGCSEDANAKVKDHVNCWEPFFIKRLTWPYNSRILETNRDGK